MPAGHLVFYPAAITEQFWFFCLGLYILTFGLAFLETAANPYVLTMGDKRTATQRLNLAQAFNPVGLIAGLFVAQQFVLKNLRSDDIADFSALEEASKVLVRTSDLLVIRNPYVMLGLVLIGVFVLFLVNKIHSPRTRVQFRVSVKRCRTGKNKKYVLGVLAQVLYVGAQIMCWTYIYQYAEAIAVDAVNGRLLSNGCFCIFFTFGRAIGTYMLQFLSSGKDVDILLYLLLFVFRRHFYYPVFWGCTV